MSIKWAVEQAMSRRVPLRPSAVSVAVVAAQRSSEEMLAMASSKLRSSWATKT
ncbi:hypothetical protein IFR08_06080 [Pseudomonas fluorescens]|nr:hypothetical protein [Pseudomonas fluorescens]MBD8773339.1 hypothetical protein [Pseudomonas fluorescens]MBD8777672.1 hypothetical protein [Pseudomonas fluorescens]MBD8794274.1 hypothetical protein [Pseudomonas fluorescens]